MILKLSGEWDVYRLQELGRLLAPGYRAEVLVLDLTGALFVTSAFLGALYDLQQTRARHGLSKVGIVVTSAFVRKLFGLAGFTDAFRLYDSLDEALSGEALAA